MGTVFGRLIVGNGPEMGRGQHFKALTLIVAVAESGCLARRARVESVGCVSRFGSNVFSGHRLQIPLETSGLAEVVRGAVDGRVGDVVCQEGFKRLVSAVFIGHDQRLSVRGAGQTIES